MATRKPPPETEGEGNVSKPETLMADGLRYELMLQHQLKALRETFQQQLLETELRHRLELDKRINRNALLSKDEDYKDQHEDGHRSNNMGMRTLMSAFALNPEKETSLHLELSNNFDSSFQYWLFPKKQKHCSIQTSMLTPTSTQQCEQLATSKTTQMKKEEEAEAECQRKFFSRPVPRHIFQQHYQEMMELREKERKKGNEQRREFLLSIQKPFSFQEREREKKVKLVAELRQVSKDQKNKTCAVRKSSNKEVKDSSAAEPNDQELHKQEPTQKIEPHKHAAVPASPKQRIANRTRREKLGFLDEKPSFQPKIIHKVPDFSRQHKALQTQALRRTQSKDVIRCQPFNLRTSALPARISSEIPQVSKSSNLRRCKSLGTITSLSTDTLPIYISDAVRNRCLAIRKTVEMKDSKNQESADWIRSYQVKSQHMRKAITFHAKLMDPRSSFKAERNEKLQHFRSTDQKRMREYMRDLQDMKARVSERPYLFEQVKQKNAKAHAQQVYRNTLKKAGIKEQFVEENGKVAEGTSTSFSSEDDTDVDETHSRYSGE